MSLAQLEERFAAQLPTARLIGPPGSDLLQAGRAWSEAVWAEAEAQGPAAIEAPEVAYGLEVAARAVFVCGVHRSGTTLVRDLLDDHPALIVLPAEGTYFASFERRLARLGDGAEGRSMFGGEWLRRMANPINQPPYWLLGRSTAERSPYVQFARGLMAWWPLTWPLAAAALAFAGAREGGVAASVRRWVEKTPLNEQYLPRLRQRFPEAKFIHVIREPEGVLASRKRMEENASGAFRNLRQVLRDLDLSYRTAAEEETASNNVLVLRYEDVVADPPKTAKHLAAFLDIEATAGLQQPTVAGLSAGRNTSFPEAGRRPMLTDQERLRLHAAVGDSAAAVGYGVALSRL